MIEAIRNYYNSIFGLRREYIQRLVGDRTYWCIELEESLRRTEGSKRVVLGDMYLRLYNSRAERLNRIVEDQARAQNKKPSLAKLLPIIH